MIDGMPSAVKADAPTILTKAILRAGERLGLSKSAIAKIIGVSAASVSRMPGRKIDLASKEGELAVLFLRMFRSLDALLGGDLEKSKLWFHANNRHLSGVPASLVESAVGLVNVIDYLDAMRGHL